LDQRGQNRVWRAKLLVSRIEFHFESAPGGGDSNLIGSAEIGRLDEFEKVGAGTGQLKGSQFFTGSFRIDTESTGGYCGPGLELILDKTGEAFRGLGSL